MDGNELRQAIRDFLQFNLPVQPISFETAGRVEADGCTRFRISYTGDEGDRISAFLLVPPGQPII